MAGSSAGAASNPRLPSTPTMSIQRMAPYTTQAHHVIPTFHTNTSSPTSSNSPIPAQVRGDADLMPNRNTQHNISARSPPLAATSFYSIPPATMHPYHYQYPPQQYHQPAATPMQNTAYNTAAYNHLPPVPAHPIQMAPPHVASPASVSASASASSQVTDESGIGSHNKPIPIDDNFDDM